MTDGQAPHGADAHIPSETEQFDRIAEQQPLSEGQIHLATQVKRLSQMSQWLIREQDAAGNMVVESHVNMILLRCEVGALSAIVEKQLKISAEEVMEAVAKEIDKSLAIYQMNYRAIFTPDGVI